MGREGGRYFWNVEIKVATPITTDIALDEYRFLKIPFKETRNNKKH